MKFLIALLALTSLNAFAVKTGELAPDFTLSGTTLSELRGKIVVLEWLNHGCPFVRKHYDSHNMQNLQKEMKGKGVVWLSVISSKPGSQGYVDVPGAIADKPDTNQESIAGARNYVREAINKTLAKEPIKANTTKAYGCAVKY